MKNNLFGVSISVLVLFSLALSTRVLLAAPAPLDVISKGGEMFLYGDNLEVGIAGNGAFGSSELSPKGNKKGKQLGYISDPSKKNFSNGYHGDFFLPKVSEEGWAITLDGESYNNNRNLQKSEIEGGFVKQKKTSSTAMVTWKGDIKGLEITQTFRIYKIGLAVIIDVALKNTTSTLMKDVYYMRTVDPDNNAEQNPLIQDHHYITTNIIMRQGGGHGGAAVAARQSKIENATSQVVEEMDSILGLCGHGANSRVVHGNAGKEYSLYYRYPDKVYNTVQVFGDTATEDSPIAIAFKMETIHPGQTVKFRAGYQLADIQPPSVDLDGDDSSGVEGNSFKQAYQLGHSAIKIADSDIVIKGLTEEKEVVAATIKISNAQVGDKLKIVGTLPSGIQIDSNEISTITEIHLTGIQSKENYEKALQQLVFFNDNNVPTHTETRRISVMILDMNFTASTAAESIIEIVMPVTLDDDKITPDNTIDADEADNLVLSGTAAPNLPIEIVFTDADGQEVATTVMSDDEGNWTLVDAPVDISTLADGPMSVKITSTDENGNPSIYTKDFEKDTTVILDIIDPQDGETTSSTHPLITIKTDPNATVTLTLPDGKTYVANADNNGDWKTTLDKQPLDAEITLSFTAVDSVGNDISKEITIKMPSIPLDVNEVAPSTTPLFTGSSLPDSTITVTVDTGDGHSESCTTTTDENGNWSCQLPPLPSGGPYAVTITTEDEGGQSTKTLEISVPELPLTVDSPMNNGQLTDSSPIVSGTSHPNSTITVKASTGEECTAITDAQGQWQCELPTLPLEEEITLTIMANDSANNSAIKTIKISTPSLPLKITGIDLSTSPTFTGDSSPKTTVVVSLPIGDGNTETCTTTTDSTGHWSCKLPILPSGGPYIATVTAEDEYGNKATDMQVLSTPELELSVDSHADNDAITDGAPAIAGTSTPNTKITVTASTGQSCVTVTGSGGFWRCNLTDLPLGKGLSVLIKAEDSIGNHKEKIIHLTTPTLPVTVDNIDESTRPILTGSSLPNTNITVSVAIDNSKTEQCTTVSDENGEWSCQMPTLPSGSHTAIITAENNQINNNGASNSNDGGSSNSNDGGSSNSNDGGSSNSNDGGSSNSNDSGNSNTSDSSNGGNSNTSDSSNGGNSNASDSSNGGNSNTSDVSNGGNNSTNDNSNGGNENTNTNDNIININNVINIEREITVPELPLIVREPINNSIISEITPIVSGTSTPGVTVNVTAPSGQRCSAVTDENNHWSCELPSISFDQETTLIVNATDSVNNTQTETVNVRTGELPLAVIAPADQDTAADSTPSFIGTSIAGAIIIVQANTTEQQQCKAITNENGDWQCELAELPAGGPYTIIIKGEGDNGEKSELTETIHIPQTSLVINSPFENETIIGTSTLVTGTSKPNITITVLGADGEKCTTISNENGIWKCQLNKLQAGDNKYITAISGTKEEGQKVSLVNVNIRNSAEKVTTILKGGGGGFSLFMLFLLSFTLWLQQGILTKAGRKNLR